jgi:hypothetical protein
MEFAQDSDASRLVVLVQQQIREDEEKLVNYAKNHEIISLDANQNTVVERLAGLNKQLLEAENDRKTAEAAFTAVATAADDVALLIARTRALDSDQVATWDLPADPAIVADARRKVAERLAGWGLHDVAFTTGLVVSELVTNAIRHAESPIQLRLIRDRTLICEVSDGSSTAPHLRRALAFDQCRARGDANFGQIDVNKRREQILVGHTNNGRRF